MAVSMGTVWDRAVEVLRGRAGLLAPIAALAVFLPSVINSAIATYVTPNVAGAGMLGGLVGLAVLVASIWGQLAMLAIATHPATTQGDAVRQANARLLTAIGIVVLLGVLLVLALMPIGLVLAAAGVGMNMADPATMRTMPSGVSGFMALYLLAFLVLAFWLGARLILLNPVILNERHGLRAIPRSFRLTRGLTWRLIGVMVLFVVLLFVTVSAVQFVVGLPLRLILGVDALPTVVFLASVVGAAVTTVFTVIAAAFTAQLYVVTAGETPAA